MMFLSPLLLIAIVGGVIYALVHATHHPHTSTHPSMAGGPAPLARTAASGAPDRTTPIHGAVEAWEHAGLISHEQADAIEAFETAVVTPTAPVMPAAPVRARRIPLVAEALGYLGGILAVVGLSLLVARYWDDMATVGRLALSGGGALALMVAGALVHEHDDASLTRMRWFLWTLSAAAAGLFGGVLAVDGIGSKFPTTVVLTVCGVLTVQNAVLWAWKARPIQQTITLAAATLGVAMAVDEFTTHSTAGIVGWALGLGLMTVAWWRLTPLPAITASVGAIAAIFGSAIPAQDWHGWGLALMTVTAAGVIVCTATPHTRYSDVTVVLLRVIGGVGMLQAVPQTIGHFGEHAGALTGLVVWSLGVGCVWLAGARWTRTPITAECVGGVMIVGGAAITGMQSVAIATVFGLATSICLIALGTIPGRVLMSLFGSLGLLINVPWAIGHFFPGEGRAPLLILVSGAVIVGVAVWLTRMGGRFRSELGRRHDVDRTELEQ